MHQKLHLGLFCHGSHDAAAAIVDAGGNVLFAAEQERYDRRKHSAAFPRAVIESGFRELGVAWKDIEAVGFAWDPFADLGRIGAYVASNAVRAVPILFKPKQNTESRLKKWLAMWGVRGELRAMGWGGSVRRYNHHLCHAASSFCASGFPSALCLTVDGNGEFASTTVHRASASGFELLYRVDYPDSLGHFYATLTQYLGFQPMNDEYKVMGLAAMAEEEGLPAFREKLARVLRVGEAEPYRLDRRYFQFFRGHDRMWSPALEELLGPARPPGSALTREHAMVARATQERLEQALLALSVKARELAPGEERLCLAGGVALNCVANQRLLRTGAWSDVFFPPYPHDSGTALGAAFLSLRENRPHLPSRRLGSASLGESLRGGAWTPPPGDGWSFAGDFTENGAAENLAKEIAAGKAVAWAMGRGEFGPRALGNRSILADPRRAENKERLNLIIKRREAFRPFAPVVLAEAADEIFEIGGHPSPFMLRTVPVRPGWGERIPAAVHVDGTARVQTLREESNPALHRLLRAFRDETGVPVLLNTSLNTAQEPIANTPEEVAAIFRRTEIDLMVLDGRIFRKG